MKTEYKFVQTFKAWDFKKVTELFAVETGTTPSTREKEYWQSGTINWITPTDLSKLTQAYISNSERKLTEKALKETNLSLLPRNSLILSTRAPIGYIAIIREESTINQGCKGLVIKDPSLIDSEFFYYYFMSKKKVLQNLGSGSTFLELSKNRLENFEVHFPPPPEQKKIAEILSTVDSAIQKVDEVIAKTERLKKGLMKELLTKGIGHKEFKDTEIGRIPKEWGVTELSKLLSLEYGQGLTENQRETGEFPVYGSNGVVGYHSKFLVKGPDIIVGRKGTIGAITWSEKNFWPIDTTYYIELKDPNLDLKWLFYKLISLNLSKLNMATGVPGLNRELVHLLKISFPPFKEQRKIAEVLSTVDEKLEFETKRKEKLERIKKGLMNDLLTGKKRIKVV